MKPLNGAGAVVATVAGISAALLAECIPAMFICLGIALSGCMWDIAHGSWVGNKRKKHR